MNILAAIFAKKAVSAAVEEVPGLVKSVAQSVPGLLSGIGEVAAHNAKSYGNIFNAIGNYINACADAKRGGNKQHESKEVLVPVVAPPPGSTI